MDVDRRLYLIISTVLNETAGPEPRDAHDLPRGTMQVGDVVSPVEARRHRSCAAQLCCDSASNACPVVSIVSRYVRRRRALNVPDLTKRGEWGDRAGD